MDIIWKNVFNFSILHIIALYGMWLLPQMQKSTLLWLCFIAYTGELGITAGVHRLWAHKSYKAKLPLRILLGFFNCIAHQNCIFDWARDHRCHHKFNETDADPHNSKRGFFYSHVGWLLTKKSSTVVEKGKTLDFKDLLNDPVVYYQKKYYVPLILICCFAMPTLIPWYFWSEGFKLAFFGNIFRYCLMLNFTFLVNSAAHKWGNKPYDKSLMAVENTLIGFLVIGEGFHNYHHVFPYDYATGEFGIYFNFTTAFIDFMAAIGQVTDRKRADKKMILARKLRTGEGVHD